MLDSVIINPAKKVFNVTRYKSYGFIRSNLLWVYTLISISAKNIIAILMMYNGEASNDILLSGLGKIHTLIAYISFAAIILSFAFLLKGRIQMWFLIVLNLLVSSLLLIDIWNYRAFCNITTLHMLNQTANLDNLSDSILSMNRTINLILLIDIVPLIFVAIRFRNMYKQVKFKIWVFILAFAIPFLTLQLLQYEADVCKKWGRMGQLFNIYTNPDTTIANLSPLGLHIFDFYIYWNDSRELVLDNEQKENIKKYFDDKQEVLPDNKYKGLFKGKNLIFIQAESLENFVINQRVSGQEITPNLNKLIQNSLYFSDFHEQTNGGTTSDAELIANTSVYPARRGSTFFRYPGNSYNSMHRLLQQLGYNTMTIHAEKGAFWNWAQSMKSIGAQKCLDYFSFKREEIIGMGISDGSFLRQTADILKKQKQPFFATTITLTNHTPFVIPDKYKKLPLDNELIGKALGRYAQSVNYFDAQIGNFISRLDENGLLDDMVIVIYGDHEAYHRYYMDEVRSLDYSGNWWVDNKKRVPLIIYSKNLKGEEVRTIGGQVDILPTVSYLMGVYEKDYSHTAFGRNLLKTNKSFAVLSNGTVICEGMSEKEKEQAVKGLHVSDIAIKSNYFSR